MEEVYIIEAETIDTYGGNFTYRNVFYIEDAKKGIIFYEERFGVNVSDEDKESFEIEDVNEIVELKRIKNMKMLNDLKKQIYKEKPKATLLYIRKGNATYKANLTDDKVLFEVPVSDMGNADFLPEMDAKLLNRWLICKI